MKKRLISVMLIFVMMFSVVGCTKSFTSYTEELKNITNWKGFTFESKGDVAITDIKSGNKEIKLPFEFKGKSSLSKAAEVNMKISLKGIKNMAAAEGAIPGTIPDNIETTVYSSIDRAYIKKDFFTNILGNQVNDDLKNIKEEYISYPSVLQLDNSMDYNKMINYVSSKNFQEDLSNLINTSLKGFKPVSDIKAEGRVYTYEADIQTLLKDILNATDKTVENYNNIENNVVDMASKLGFNLTKEQLREFVKSYNKESAAKALESVSKELNGSKIYIKESFKDNSYTEDMNLIITNNKDFKVNVNLKQVCNRDDNIKVELPKSVKNLTAEEYMALMVPKNLDIDPMIEVKLNGKDVDFKDVQPLIVENRTLVPFRALLEEMGSEVKWDEAKKEVIAKSGDNEVILKIGSKEALVNGKKVNLDVPAQIKDGRTMIPLRFISENFGYKVNFNNENKFLYIITIEK